MLQVSFFELLSIEAPLLPILTFSKSKNSQKWLVFQNFEKSAEFGRFLNKKVELKIENIQKKGWSLLFENRRTAENGWFSRIFKNRPNLADFCEKVVLEIENSRNRLIFKRIFTMAEFWKKSKFKKWSKKINHLVFELISISNWKITFLSWF